MDEVCPRVLFFLCSSHGPPGKSYRRRQANRHGQGGFSQITSVKGEEGPLSELLSSMTWLSGGGVGCFIQQSLFTGSSLVAPTAPQSQLCPGKAQLLLALCEIKRLTLHNGTMKYLPKVPRPPMQTLLFLRPVALIEGHWEGKYICLSLPPFCSINRPKLA